MLRSLFVLGLSLFLLAGTSLHAAEPESAYDRVMRTNTLRCAYVTTAPYAYKDLQTGEMAGLSIEIANEVAKALHLTLEWAAEVGFADFAEGFRTGRYDAFCGALTITPPRARVAAFTSPLFYVPYRVYGRKDEQRFHALSDINQPSVTVATVDGEAFQFVTRLYLPHAHEYNLPNMTPPGQLFVDVADKKADAIIHDPLLMAMYAQSNGDKIKPLLPGVLESRPHGFAVGPKDLALLHVLDTAILTLQTTGVIDSILKKYEKGTPVLGRVR